MMSTLFDSETTTPESRAYLSSILGNDYIPGGIERVSAKKISSGYLGNRSPRSFVESTFADNADGLRAFKAATETFLYTPVRKSDQTLTYVTNSFS